MNDILVALRLIYFIPNSRACADGWTFLINFSFLIISFFYRWHWATTAAEKERFLQELFQKVTTLQLGAELGDPFKSVPADEMLFSKKQMKKKKEEKFY